MRFCGASYCIRTPCSLRNKINLNNLREELQINEYTYMIEHYNKIVQLYIILSYKNTSDSLIEFCVIRLRYVVHVYSNSVDIHVDELFLKQFATWCIYRMVVLLYSRIFWKSLNVYSTIVTATLNSIVLLYASNILISIITIIMI